jgi:hypothetical protein
VSTANVIVAVLISIAWLLAFTSWRLRNWRAVVVLLGVSAFIVAVGLVAPSLAPWLQVAIWISVVEILFVRGGLLSVVGRSEDSFLERHMELIGQIAQLKSRAQSTDPAEYTAKFAAIIEGLRALKPPSSKLAELNADTIRELERRLVLLKLSTRPAPEVFERMDTEWSRIESRRRRALESMGRFWAGWPEILSRPGRRPRL